MKRVRKYERMMDAIDEKILEHQNILEYLNDKYRIINKHDILTYNEAISCNIESHIQKIEALKKYRDTLLASREK